MKSPKIVIVITNPYFSIFSPSPIACVFFQAVPIRTWSGGNGKKAELQKNLIG